jgi:hypothetical protein
VYSIGEVTIDKQQGSVSFPVSINQRTGVVEYVVVNTGGKTHESVFRTPAAPRDVHVGMLLLGVKPADTNAFPQDGNAPLPGQQVWVELQWHDQGREVSRPIEAFVVTTNNLLPLSPGSWVYNGSFTDYRTFIAQRDGSIISIQSDPTALVNNPRPERTNDDLHHVNTAALPPPEAQLKLSLRLLAPAPAVTTNQAFTGGVITPVTPPVIPVPNPKPSSNP